MGVVTTVVETVEGVAAPVGLFLWMTPVKVRKLSTAFHFLNGWYGLGHYAVS